MRKRICPSYNKTSSKNILYIDKPETGTKRSSCHDSWFLTLAIFLIEWRIFCIRDARQPCHGRKANPHTGLPTKSLEFWNSACTLISISRYIRNFFEDSYSAFTRFQHCLKAALQYVARSFCAVSKPFHVRRARFWGGSKIPIHACSARIKSLPKLHSNRTNPKN